VYRSYCFWYCTVEYSRIKIFLNKCTFLTDCGIVRYTTASVITVNLYIYIFLTVCGIVRYSTAEVKNFKVCEQVLLLLVLYGIAVQE
jgi:hypothetical protein